MIFDAIAFFAATLLIGSGLTIALMDTAKREKPE